MRVDVEVKTCIRCETEKPVTDFHTRKRADGSKVPRGTCKACQAAEDKAARLADPDRFRAYGRTHRAKESRRARSLREKYGMTIEQWDAIWEAQGFVCAVCRGESNDPSMHGDHDHETGVFRAILCGLCNRMLGQGQDSSERLLAGARYLQEHGR